MIKWFTILLFLMLPALSAIAQDDATAQEGKLRERCQQYVQDRLGLNKAEAEKFSPVFIRYFREFAQTHRQYKDDRLIFKQKIIDLRIRYREEFRQILDEKKANRVYLYEDEFRKRAMDIIRENKKERMHNKPVRQNKIITQRTI